MTAGPPRWTDDWPAPRTSQRPNGAWIALGVVCAFAVAVAAAIGLAIQSFDDQLSHIGQRKHLKPIPIAADACPYVAVMHAAATNFQDAYPPMFPHASALRDRSQWRPVRQRLASTAAVLEQSIDASLRHVPPAVEAQLTTTAHDLHEGRRQLAQARDAQDMFDRTLDLYASGRLAFGYASDLVGNGCRTPLAAGPSTQG